jgi:hypothetical protein
MQESYSERLAIYTGPESCGVVREDNVEALTGESAGRVAKKDRRSGSLRSFTKSTRWKHCAWPISVCREKLRLAALKHGPVRRMLSVLVVMDQGHAIHCNRLARRGFRPR